MEPITLSLKNIYRLLMNDDFPIYSKQVIGKKERRGQTLLRFRQDMMVREFCCLPYGKMIWRNDGTRNRYISNLCNRNDELKYYHEYAQELGAQICAETLLSQIRRFVDFLKSREHNCEALLYRAKGLLNGLREDPFVKEPILEQLWAIHSAAERFTGCGVQGGLFHGAYLLTVMSLYAAAGEAMNDPAMAVLHVGDLGMDAMWALYSRQQEQGSGAVRILTAHVGLLQDAPLPKDRFFGREEALFDLREIAVTGGEVPAVRHRRRGQNRDDPAAHPSVPAGAAGGQAGHRSLAHGSGREPDPRLSGAASAGSGGELPVCAAPAGKGGAGREAAPAGGQRDQRSGRRPQSALPCAAPLRGDSELAPQRA